jgi:hypothetical protein
MFKLIFLIIIIVVVGAFFTHTYISSPGHVTPEGQAQFDMTKQTCFGYSYLMNREAMAADAPGKSLCIGILK